jgi:uncharacterized protein (TIGR02246 family)
MTHRQALEQLFDAWRRGDALRSAAHFAPGATYREAGRRPIVGRDAIVEHFNTFFRDGPRWEFHADDTLVEGDRAAVQYRFAIVSADGTWHERSGCAFVVFTDGTIAEWREYQG